LNNLKNEQTPDKIPIEPSSSTNYSFNNYQLVSKLSNCKWIGTSFSI